MLDIGEMNIHYFLKFLFYLTHINSVTYGNFYFIDLKIWNLTSYTHLTLTLYGLEQLHYLSIRLRESIPRPILPLIVGF